MYLTAPARKLFHSYQAATTLVYAHSEIAMENKSDASVPIVSEPGVQK